MNRSVKCYARNEARAFKKKCRLRNGNKLPKKRSILNALKKIKIAKEFNQFGYEELFKPLIKRKNVKETLQKTQSEVPDYGMDDFDYFNPFDENFRRDEETPPQSPSPSQSASHGDEDDFPTPLLQSKNHEKLRG